MSARLFPALFAAAALAGCPSSDDHQGRSDVTGTDDTSTSDVADAVIVFDTATGTSTTTATTTDTSAPADTSVEPGAFGAPCDDGGDCDSGHCVPTPDGFECTRTCIASCNDDDYVCAGVPQTTGDVVFLCLHVEPLLCQPCTTSAECNPGVAGTNACVSYGMAGSFCGTSCDSDGDCPGGYTCDEVPAAGSKQCMPSSGVCACNPSGIALGMSTTCLFTNEHGTCGGTRACGAEGLTACGGEGAAPETCNNQDDDCNGKIDDGIPGVACEVTGELGACAGTTACVGGEQVCVGLVPSEEKCNGVDDDCNDQTDEGFTDTDTDAMADCVDPDDDNDGSPDTADCAPLDKDVYPGATERCNGKDDDCDLSKDEENAQGCTTFRRDADDDDFGAAAGGRCLCGPDALSGHVLPDTQGGDCNDFDPNVRPGVAEACNFIDDDCDGNTDEGVASPCGGCTPVCLLGVGEHGDEPLDPDNGETGALVPTEDGYLSLSTASVSIPFIWIANSPQDTVSKLDTQAVTEVGRYFVCDDPSRTAVDLFGDAVVACRGDGKVAKVAIAETDCIDVNGNGVINTARDANGDGTIQTGERVTPDECVLWTVQPDGVPSVAGCNEASSSVGCARAAGVDRDNNVWVGFWNSKRLRQLDGQTGATLRTFDLSFRPYGLAIAADGAIWVASRDPYGVGKVDPVAGEQSFFAIPGDRQVYGMALDHLGKVWVATGASSGASRLDPVDGAWTHLGPWDSRGWTRGVAVKLVTDASGNVTGSTVFVAHHTWSDSTACTTSGHRHVSVIDAATATEGTAIDLGVQRGPVGVAVAIDGMLWTVNQCGSSATRVDPSTGAVLATKSVGSNPYTYSDMTGYALRTITSRTGYYRETFEGWQAGVTRWSAIVVDADLPGDGTTYVRIRYRTASTLAGINSATFSATAGPFPPAALPYTIDATGRFIQVEVTLATDDPEVIPTLRGVSVLGDQL